MFKNILKKIIAPVLLLIMSCTLLVACGSNKGPKLESIALTSDICVNYALNDTIELKEAQLKLVYSDDTTKEVEITADMISGFDTSTVGTKTLTITYNKRPPKLIMLLEKLDTVCMNLRKGIYIGVQLSAGGVGMYYSSYQGTANEPFAFNWTKSGEVISLSGGGQEFTTLNIVSSTQLNLSADYTYYPLTYVF